MIVSDRIIDDEVLGLLQNKGGDAYYTYRVAELSSLNSGHVAVRQIAVN